MFERRYFVVAPSFHGATLLSKLLNDHPAIVSLGDTYPSNRFDQVCGCGMYVSECPFWQTVFELLGAERYRDFPHLLPNYPAIFGGAWDRVLYNTFPPRLLRRIISNAARQEFARDFETFIAAVHKHSGSPEASIFVDGVKSISRVFALAASGIKIDGVIHLHRDPGDYIKSTMKQKGYSWRRFIRGLIGWRLFHNRACRIGKEVPYISLTYEGLSERPDESLQGLFEFFRVTPMAVTDLVKNVNDRPWHFMGNASLFNFDGTIKRSQYDLSGRESMMVRLLAGFYSEHVIHLSNKTCR